jgi:predicted amidohydrolase
VPATTGGTVRVAAIQHDIAWKDPEANFEHLRPLIEQAAGNGAELVVLTEMYSTGFSMDTERIAEAPNGPSTAFLVRESHRHGIWICGSIAEREVGAELAQNVAVIAGPDGSLRRYAKIHPFSHAKEHEHYRAGTTPLTLPIADCRVTVFICYDLRFADEFWHLAERTDCYVVIANWPAARRAHWQALLPARAIENQAYVVGVNRVGDGNGVAYVGDSAIIDPLGRILDEADDDETILMANVDPAVVAKTRARYPFLKDRR